MKGPRSSHRPRKQASIQQDVNSKILANDKHEAMRQPVMRGIKPTPRDRTASLDSISSSRARDHDEDKVAPLNQAGKLIAGQDQCLAELVWKFFETEIREALIEVQNSLGSLDAEGNQSTTQENRREEE